MSQVLEAVKSANCPLNTAISSMSYLEDHFPAQQTVILFSRSGFPKKLQDQPKLSRNGHFLLTLSLILHPRV